MQFCRRCGTRDNGIPAQAASDGCVLCHRLLFPSSGCRNCDELIKFTWPGSESVRMLCARALLLGSRVFNRLRCTDEEREELKTMLFPGLLKHLLEINTSVYKENGEFKFKKIDGSIYLVEHNYKAATVGSKRQLVLTKEKTKINFESFFKSKVCTRVFHRIFTHRSNQPNEWTAIQTAYADAFFKHSTATICLSCQQAKLLDAWQVKLESLSDDPYVQKKSAINMICNWDFETFWKHCTRRNEAWPDARQTLVINDPALRELYTHV